MVPPKITGGSIWPGSKTAPPCYGKAIGHLTHIIGPGHGHLKGAALIATFIGVLIIFVMWVSLWDNVWRVSVEPTDTIAPV